MKLHILHVFSLVLLPLLCLLPAPAHADSLPVVRGEPLTISFKGIAPAEISSHSGLYRVDDEGYIRMPYLKERVRAGGLTVSKLERVIAQLYQSSKIYPSVTITIQKAGDAPIPKITISGKRATKPGQVDFVREMTLADAVALGAPNQFFRGTVHLIRRGRTFKYDVNQEKSKVIPLKPKDLVELVR